MKTVVTEKQTKLNESIHWSYTFFFANPAIFFSDSNMKLWAYLTLVFTITPHLKQIQNKWKENDNKC